MSVVSFELVCLLFAAGSGAVRTPSAILCAPTHNSAGCAGSAGQTLTALLPVGD